jgi:hypothetical protein
MIMDVVLRRAALRAEVVADVDAILSRHLFANGSPTSHVSSDIHKAAHA